MYCLCLRSFLKRVLQVEYVFLRTQNTVDRGMVVILMYFFYDKLQYSTVLWITYWWHDSQRNEKSSMKCFFDCRLVFRCQKLIKIWQFTCCSQKGEFHGFVLLFWQIKQITHCHCDPNYETNEKPMGHLFLHHNGL